jgi:hypothetical protein
MARPPGRHAEEDQEGDENEESVQSTSEDEHPVIPVGRQETPDIYRNSALGM